MIRGLTISPSDFDAALRLTNSDPAGAAIRGARLVLILGLTVARAAQATGCTRQAVNAAKCRILDSCPMCPTCGRPKDPTSGRRAFS